MTSRNRGQGALGTTVATFLAFGIPDYRWLWASGLFYQIARWMQLTIFAWLVLELTDSPFKVALVGFFMTLPRLAFGLPGGALADSFSRVWLVRIALNTSTVVAIAVTVLLGTDLIRVWHVYAAIFVTGLAFTIEQPARRALVLDMLGPTRVTNGMALDMVAFSSSRIVGPAVAGALLTLAGVTPAYSVACCLFFLAGTLIFVVQVTQVARRQWQAGQVVQDLGAGLRYAFQDPVVRAVVVITILVNLLTTPYQQMVPVIARDVLSVGPALMGIMLASDGLGTFIGSLTLASVPSFTRHGLVFAFGAMLAALSLAVLSFSDTYGLSVATLVLLGIGTAGFGTMQGAIVVLIAPHQMRGRALGVVALAIGASPLGSLMIGSLATAADPTAAIRIHGFLGLVLIALVTLVSLSIRRPIPRPDTPPR